ncbi:hypothetical protein BC829DRAFT_65728 [Chytridium lagenaria]|nr:hypothetical protein BC829DRAFT_65728 [Chytridium lagenaria]
MSELQNAHHLVKDTEESKNKVTIRLLKEREMYKITIAEIKKENEIYRDTIFKLERDLNYLQDALQHRDAEFNSKLEYSKNVLLQGGEETSEVNLKGVTAAKEKEIEELKEQLLKAKERLLEVESELTAKIRDLEVKASKSQALIDEQIKNLSESAKSVSQLEFREKELIATIRKFSGSSRRTKTSNQLTRRPK